jgi:hypothetical protein
MVVMNYRTEDRLANYGFSIEFCSPKSWRAYIAFRPLCQNHDDQSGFDISICRRSGA